jgi:hypothetical protein
MSNQPKNIYNLFKYCFMIIKTKNLIQETSLLIFTCVLCTVVYGQAKPTVLSKIYFQGAVGASSRNGMASEIGIQAVLKNNWITTVSYNGIDMRPKNLPGDFDPGATIILFIPIEGKTPSVDMKLLSLTVGKYYKGGRNTWYTTEAGLSLVNGKEISFSKNTGDPSTWYFLFVGDMPSNYTFSEQKKTTMGAMLKADFNWAFSSFAGLGLGAFANFNSIQSPVGFQCKLIIGKMNREKKH